MVYDNMFFNTCLQKHKNSKTVQYSTLLIMGRSSSLDNSISHVVILVQVLVPVVLETTSKLL